MNQHSVEQRRPHMRLLAIAMSLVAGPGVALGQTSGATVVHGQASYSTQGNQLTVTTANGAGTRHSAINWQSFSVPQGSVTRFNQPDAASTSINRVLGSDPSKILGTLSSNGRLVLVNPAGITVGQGAAVNTAGFTASTLRMSDADALAGRLRFDGGLPGATLRVDGSVLAQVGDVILISPNVVVGPAALVRAPDGAVVLAAGQTVELTGRGLEGIRMEVVAPTDSAVNFGTLEGDAVGMFAGTLRHSGLIRAVGAELDGNKLRLVATHSKQVDGDIRVGPLKLTLAYKLNHTDDDDEDSANDDDRDRGSERDRDRDRDEDDRRAPARAPRPAPSPAPVAATPVAAAPVAAAPVAAAPVAAAPVAAAPVTAPAPATTPAPAPAATSSSTPTAAAPAPAPAPTAAPAAAPAPAANQPVVTAGPTAPAPAPEPAPASISLISATTLQLPAAVAVQTMVAEARQQQGEVISALNRPAKSPEDERIRRGKHAIAIDEQCVR